MFMKWVVVFLIDIDDFADIRNATHKNLETRFYIWNDRLRFNRNFNKFIKQSSNELTVKYFRKKMKWNIKKIQQRIQQRIQQWIQQQIQQ